MWRFENEARMVGTGGGLGMRVSALHVLLQCMCQCRRRAASRQADALRVDQTEGIVERPPYECRRRSCVVSPGTLTRSLLLHTYPLHFLGYTDTLSHTHTVDILCCLYTPAPSKKYRVVPIRPNAPSTSESPASDCTVDALATGLISSPHRIRAPSTCTCCTHLNLNQAASPRVGMVPD